MADLKSFINDLSKLKRRALDSTRTAFLGEATRLVNEFQDRSPVDDDIFRKNWSLSPKRGSGGTLQSVSILNKTPYGIYLDDGAEIGGAPWYWPKASNPGPVSNSGKLKTSGGRVWAGGLSPSGFVIGGISDVILFNNPKRKLKMAQEIAEAFVRVV